MAPAASKSKAYSNPISTQADDVKYRTKYKELKTKVAEIEDDNTKLSVKILKSKKAIQRLRIERAILYDRLQNTTAPTNPYALSSAAHLSTLASTTSQSTSNGPPSILSTPSYPLADPEAPSLFLKQLDAQKLAALQRGEAGFGEMPKAGVQGEGAKEQEEKDLLAAGPPVVVGQNGQQANGAGAGTTLAATSNGEGNHSQVSAQSPPQLASSMQVDQA
ncbi:uncharacterized protein JCM6883_003332 [Sporobolomyces salmoneus]|uniref:uncharacterized protein n=1 Tax=Sporobolomyces salmoneus TaxID=183962 RepID=UPI00317A09FD